MNVDLYEFETTEGAGVEAGAALGEDVTPAADPAAVTEGTPSPAAPEAAPAWTPDPDEFAAMQAQLATFQQRFGQLDQTQQQQQGEDVDYNEFLNPLSDNFGQNFMQLLQQRDEFLLSKFGEQVQPIRSHFEQQQRTESSELIKDVIADEVARNGDMSEDAKGIVETLARGLYPDLQAKYAFMGPQAANKAADMAMEQTFKTLRSIEKAAEQRGEERAKNQLGVLANANREPGTGAAAIQHGDAASVDDALERWASSRTAA